MARTSRPREGLCASTTAGSSANSRAITSFCALPPDRSAARWPGLRTPRTSKAPIAARVAARAALRSKRSHDP
ncbi:hypothetical protein N1F91_26080 [Aquibium sp. ELW1220]|nr:hypothetical protein [Aquibium sp. ELW1220]MDN2583456.1 hypothetical protein [Aquibium sp. ELW1220]